MDEDAVLTEFLNSVNSPKYATTASTDSRKIEDTIENHESPSKHVKDGIIPCELVNGDSAQSENISANRHSSSKPNEGIDKSSVADYDTDNSNLLGGCIFPEVPVSAQPSRDRGKGRLLAGPGARVGGVQPRPTELRRSFFKLTSQQEIKLAGARKFAMEQNVANVLAKQREEQIKIKKDPLANAALRQQVLSLMSRVYVGGINFDVKEDALRSVFCHYGVIKKIDFSWETPNVKHKGFSFIEFEVPDMAQLVLNSTTHHLIQGRPVKIGRPSNMPQATPYIDVVINESKKYPRIFVSNIHPDIVESDLKSVFEAFGTIIAVDMPIDLGTMKHKGYAFVDYSDHKAANDAAAAMNRFDIGGQLLRVGRSVSIPDDNSRKTLINSTANSIAASVANAINSDQSKGYLDGTKFSASKHTPDNRQSPSHPSIKPEFYQGTKFSEKENESNTSPNLSSNISSTLNSNNNTTASVDSSTTVTAVEDTSKDTIDESIAAEEIMSIKGSDQRFLMMRKLAALRKQKQNVLVMRNMVLPEEIDENLEIEISEECEKHGSVKSVLIKTCMDTQFNIEVVKIFVEFDEENSAKTAQAALHGRYFAGRIISVEVYDAMKFKYGDYSG